MKNHEIAREHVRMTVNQAIHNIQGALMPLDADRINTEIVCGLLLAESSEVAHRQLEIFRKVIEVAMLPYQSYFGWAYAEIFSQVDTAIAFVKELGE